jgi:CubicO group peptidase (beta-lactamase class C family)
MNCLLEWMEEARVPGTAVAYINRGEEDRIECYGECEAGFGKIIHPGTLFEAASLSKPLFAAAVTGLIVDGVLDPDLPLSEMVSPPPVVEGDLIPLITARVVLSHSSGLPNWRKNDEPMHFNFRPGEKFGYSGEGYVYLQQAVECRTGLGLEQFLQQNLIQPLQMVDTSYVWDEQNAANVAIGHGINGEMLPKGKPGFGNAATSLHTTAADYSKFIRQMLEPKQAGGLSPAVVRLMLEPQIKIEKGADWGMGWGIKTIAKNQFFWQWGDNYGFKHIAAGSVELGKAILILTNGENGHQVWSKILKQTIDHEETIFRFLCSI